MKQQPKLSIEESQKLTAIIHQTVPSLINKFIQDEICASWIEYQMIETGNDVVYEKLKQWHEAQKRELGKYNRDVIIVPGKIYKIGSNELMIVASIYSDAVYQCANYASQQRQEFEAQFISRWKHNTFLLLNNLTISAYIQQELKLIMELFYKKHHWLKPDLLLADWTYNSPLSYYFLQNIINQIKPEIKKITNIAQKKTFDKIPTVIIRAIAMVKTHYFLSAIPSENFQKKLPQYQQLNSHHSSEQLLNSRPSRLDIFRLIGALDSWLTIQPMSLDEVQLLTKKEKAHFSILLVNLATEALPLWAIIKKWKKSWVGYIPEIKNRKKLQSLSNDLASVCNYVQTVDSRANFLFDANLKLKGHAKWHAIIFGRILPWCMQDAALIDLNSYRNTAPVSLILPVIFSQFTHNISIMMLLSAHLTQLRTDTDYSLFYNIACVFPQYLKDTLTGFNSTLSLIPPTDNQGASLIINSKEHCMLSFFSVSFLLYCYSLKKLEILAPITFYDVDHAKSNSFELEMKKSLDQNHSLLELTSTISNHALLNYAMACAARNRYLLASQTHTENWSWEYAGKLMASFVQEQGSKLSVNNLNMITLQQNVSDNIIVDNATLPPFFLMGTPGLDALFLGIKNHYYELKKTYQPLNLTYFFEIDDTLTKTLLKKIEDLYSFYSNPIFSQLSLLVKNNEHSALAKLIVLINERYSYNPKDASEITLYCNPQSPMIPKLINQLVQECENQYFLLMIKIPNLDRIADKKLSAVKGAYLNLQNKINANRQRQTQHYLLENTRSLYRYQKNELPALVNLQDNQEPLQTWLEDDVFYVLDGTHQIQFEQQQQQQQKQQQQQEQQQQHVVQHKEFPVASWEHAPLAVLPDHQGKVKKRVTRDTINQTYQAMWDDLPTEQQQKFKSMKHLFSLWVGSKYDARFVIHAIECEAIDKIMAQDNLSSFNFSLEQETRPAGFCLAVDNGEIILCFDAEREKEELAAQEKIDIQQRNPFIIKLNFTRKTPRLFAGDCRQLQGFSSAFQGMQTLWLHLALEDEDEERLHNAWKMLGNEAIDKSSAAVALHSAYNNQPPSLPEPELFQCLDLLQAWVTQKLGKAAGDQNFFSQLLFGTSRISLTAKNLKALGQLFNHYGTLAPNNKPYNALACFFYMARELFTAFGHDQFKIWKTHFLDAFDDWTHCLEKSEVDAIFLSIVTLKGKEASLRAAWWQLVDTHARVVGYVQYAQLWYAFQHVIAYLDAKNLQLNLASWEHYLTHTQDGFHAQVFLFRLYRVLRNTELQVDNHHIQQDILHHLHAINWSHNGFFYASAYENYVYWRPELRLSRFFPRHNNRYPSYLPELNKTESIQTQVLRFATLYLPLTYAEFPRFQHMLTQAMAGAKKAPENVALWMYCLVAGVDNWQSLKATPPKNDQRSPQEKYLWQGTMIALIKPLNVKLVEIILSMLISRKPEQLEMHFMHIPLFLQILEKENNAYLRYWFEGETIQNQQQFINMCGRALHCFAYFEGSHQHKANVNIYERYKAQEEQLQLCLNHFAQDVALTHPKLFNFPWINPTLECSKNIISADNREICAFLYQLRTINFSQSTYLPSIDEINSFVDNIARKKITRGHVISTLINRGCEIRQQDALFRSLSNQEITLFSHQFISQLHPSFREQNIALYTGFITDYLAVSATDDLEATQQVKALMSFMLSLDHSREYNQLGQVLGLLLSMANQGGIKRRYCAPQLLTWLTAFIYDSKIQSSSYPLMMLETLLTCALNDKNPQPAGLLHFNLHYLTADVSNKNLLETVKKLNKTELSNQYKPIFITLNLKDRKSNQLYANIITESLLSLQSAASLAWLNAFYKFLNQCLIELDDVDLLQHMAATLGIEQLADPSIAQNPTSMDLWDRTHVKLLNILMAKKLKLASLPPLQRKNDEHCWIRVILIQTFSENNNDNLFDVLAVQLLALDLDISLLKELAHYCDLHPALTQRHLVTALTALASQKENNKIASASTIIHYFETQILPKNADGTSKITSSVSDNLLRVLKKMKYKGYGFIPDATQKSLLSQLAQIEAEQLLLKPEHLTLELLNSNINGILAILSENREAKNAALYQRASLQLLVYLRMLVLRKTGMWAKDTQLIALLYTVLPQLHTDGTILQIETGGGKSVVELMRITYWALLGYKVDAVGAKDDLCRRDYLQARPVLAALHIPCGYVHADSGVDDYQNRRVFRKGTVNFGTQGNLALLRERRCWDGKSDLLPTPQTHITYLDEVDYMLLDETKQYNFAIVQEGYEDYNLDAWVYKVTYQFYLEKKLQFRKNADNKIVVSSNGELRELYERLYAARSSAPARSTFFAKYLSGGKDACAERDIQLLKLLSAAHVTAGLKLDVDYCINQEPTPKCVKGQWIPTRTTSVLGEYGIIPNATFSKLVHQFLHTRLNLEALAKHEPDNFFIEPYAETALSLNPASVNDTYDIVAGATATAGDETELGCYASKVVKLAAHQESKKIYLPTQYCDSEEEQMLALVAQIRQAKGQYPILIACQNDEAMKDIALKVLAHFSEAEKQAFNIIIDSHDQNRREEAILPLLGLANTIAFSSRLGRGTDIQSQTDAGLQVICTYSTLPRRKKQDDGRTARNGGPGSCIAIIDYAQVLADIQNYKEKGYAAIFQNFYTLECKHLKKKREKHQQLGSDKWLNLLPQQDEEKYLLTRSLERLKSHVKRRETKQFEALLGRLSMASMTYLPTVSLDEDDKRKYQQAWMKCKKAIEDCWQQQLSQPSVDYPSFIQQILPLWTDFSLQHSPKHFPLTLLLDTKTIAIQLKSLKQQIENFKKIPASVTTIATTDSMIEAYQHQLEALQEQWDLILSLQQPESMESDFERLQARLNSILQYGDTFLKCAFHTTPQQAKDMPAVLKFYQTWLTNIEKHWTHLSAKEPLTAIYGKNDTGYNHFWNVVRVHSQKDLAAKAPVQKRQRLFAGLTTLAQLPASYCLSCQTWAEAIPLIAEATKKMSAKKAQQYFENLSAFFQGSYMAGQTPAGLTEETIRNNDRLFKLFIPIATVYSTLFEEGVVNHLTKIISTNLKDLANDAITALFAQHPDITTLLLKHTNEADLRYFIQLLCRTEKPGGGEQGEQLFKYLQTYAPQLDKTPGIIREAFDYFLNPASLKISNVVTLPAPDCLPLLTKTQKSQFFHFLAKRRLPCDIQARDSMLDILSVYKNNHRFKDEIFTPLMNLPPYISLNYIEAHLQLHAGPHNYSGLKDKLALIAEAGEYFNQFMQARNFIPLDDSPIRPESIAPWIDEFTRRSPEVNRHLFKNLCKQKKLSTEALALYVHNHNSNDAVFNIEALKVYEQALRCQKDQTQLENLFSQLDGPQAILRKQMMRYLEQGRLSQLGNQFSEQCYQHYHTLADTLLQTKIPESHFTHHQLLNNHYRKVMQLTQEIGDVASPLPQAPHNDNNAVAPAAVNLHYEQITNALKQRYKDMSFWGKSFRRRSESTQVFAKFNEISTQTYLNKTEAYQSTLQQIWSIQQWLIARDKNKRCNQKGYSRLYDIVTHLFLTVASDYLKDQEVAFGEKRWLATLLQEQVVFHTNQARLHFHKHDLPQLLHNGSENAPKHLRYLLNNLQQVTQLSNIMASTAPEAQDVLVH